MIITKEKLLQSDLNTLFTRDPGTFFEAILINLLWDKTPENLDQELIARQRYVFEQWHKYYATNLTAELQKAIEAAYVPKMEKAYKNGVRAGKIAALEHLPLKKSGFVKSVDLTAVAQLLRKLKNHNQGDNGATQN